jgi:hypothetical protein
MGRDERRECQAVRADRTSRNLFGSARFSLRIVARKPRQKRCQASLAIRGRGTTALSWRKFSTDFVAAGSQTTIVFINGDPSNDTSNGIDAVSVVLDPD